ncbi:hypothetical protein SDJN03_06957, partial [Cucurbita argyrosperma subsp. sororia]
MHQNLPALPYMSSSTNGATLSPPWLAPAARISAWRVSLETSTRSEGGPPVSVLAALAHSQVPFPGLTLEKAQTPLEPW